MFLLDTDVLSELRRSRRDRNVVAWIGDVTAADLFLSVVTIGEIELGIARQQVLNPDFAQELTDWLDVTLRPYGERILPLTVGIARRWGSPCNTAWQQTARSRNCSDSTRTRPHRGDAECFGF
jgi:predicted nucleic acid-binding protein